MSVRVDANVIVKEAKGDLRRAVRRALDEFDIDDVDESEFTRFFLRRFRPGWVRVNDSHVRT